MYTKTHFYHQKSMIIQPKKKIIGILTALKYFNNNQTLSIDNNDKTCQTKDSKEDNWLLGGQLANDFSNLLKRWVERERAVDLSACCHKYSCDIWGVRRNSLFFLPSPSDSYYAMLITHSDWPTFPSALFSYWADIRTMDKMCKYSSKFNDPSFSSV